MGADKLITAHIFWSGSVVDGPFFFDFANVILYNRNMTNFTLHPRKSMSGVYGTHGINPKRTGIVGSAAGIKGVVVCPKCLNDMTKLIKKSRAGRHYCLVCNHEFSRDESL